MHTLFNHIVPPSALQETYKDLVSGGLSLRRREQASALGLSEAALIDAQLGCLRLRLKDNFPPLIEQLHRLGYIMTLTRNEAAVHERKGHYPFAHIRRPVGLVIAEDRKIDLRLLFNHWHQGFAVSERLPSGIRYSLQFFDHRGVAVQKIFLQPNSDFDAFFDLIRTFRAEDQSTALQFEPRSKPGTPRPDQHVDIKALTRDWSALTDVHHFFGLLKEHDVTRQQAFRLVGPPWAQQFAPARLQALLQQAADQSLPLMCFVGNRGNIQIHSGVIHTIKTVGPWLNILDPEFNLHLDMTHIRTAWLIRKPSRDGVITSLELYTEQGDTAVQFFGVREEGNPENPHWRTLAESVLQPDRACA